MIVADLNFQYIPSAEQIADIITKPLSFIHFNYLWSKLNVQPCPLSLRGAIKEAHCAELTKNKKVKKLQPQLAKQVSSASSPELVKKVDR